MEGVGGQNNFSQKDDKEKQINQIKTSLIATMIMEYTRRLPSETKRALKKYCDRRNFEEIYTKEVNFEDKKKNIIKNLNLQHHSNINLLQISSVKDIHEKIDKTSDDKESELLKMFNQASHRIDWNKAENAEVLASRKKVFLNFYDDMISKAKKQ